MVIQIVKRIDGASLIYDGKYVAVYDPSAHEPDGSYIGGVLEVTEDPAKAKQFPDMMAAIEEWKRTPGCECHATRPWDGQPNRPLSAFTVTIVPIQERQVTPAKPSKEASDAGS